MKAIVHFDFVESPLGRLRLTAVREGLTGIGFDGDRYAPPLDPAWVRDPAFPVLRRAAAHVLPAPRPAGIRLRSSFPAIASSGPTAR